jgi:membrane protease YdiL (CAAX protease family)
MAHLDNPSSESIIIRFWQRVPVIIRAVVSGYFVFAIGGTVAWMAVLALIPVPWSLVAMWVVLGLYLKYFSGSWWPKRTAQVRSDNFRASKLSAGTWKWSLISAFLIVVIIESGLVVTFRIIEFPADAMSLGLDYSAFPLWLVWLYIILMASVAGITEEVGFRGYMQVPFEKRYGPVVSICFVAVLFMVLHLNQAWAPFVLFQLFVIGVMWGILVCASGSLIPTIISHTAADIFSFSYWWTDVAGSFNKRPIAETGFDPHFFTWALILMVSIALFVWTVRKTLTTRQSG